MRDTLARLPASRRRSFARHARRGVAAVEFALTMPVLVLILFGMYDIAMGWIMWRRLETATTAIAQVATMTAVQADTSNWLAISGTTDQAVESAKAIFPVLPLTQTGSVLYAVVLSSVQFSNPPTCPADRNGVPTYCVARVVWSKAARSTYLINTPLLRCRTQTSVPNQTAPDATMLPASAYQANPLLVVDTYYQYSPPFLSSLFPTYTMHWMAYFPSRSGIDQASQLIGYGTINGSIRIPDPSYCS